jgi:hypothetical protein
MTSSARIPAGASYITASTTGRVCERWKWLLEDALDPSLNPEDTVINSLQTASAA